MSSQENISMEAQWIIDSLRAENARLREALESCVSGTHMWVITPESARHCQEAFDYIRNIARAALAKEEGE